MIKEPNYEFGNDATMEVSSLKWDIGEAGMIREEASIPVLDAFAEQAVPMPGSAEWQAVYESKLVEIRDNWMIVRDPESEDGRTYEITVANADALGSEKGSILRISNETVNYTVEAIELAEDAVANPGRAIIHLAMPGAGATTGLSELEVNEARENGRLVSVFNGTDYDAFPSIKSMARTIGRIKGKVSYISSSDKAAHFASALMAALPAVEGAFLANPSNISDQYSFISNLLALRRDFRFGSGYSHRGALEFGYAHLYEEKSTDPLSITPARAEQARLIMGDDFAKHTQGQREALGRFIKVFDEGSIYKKGMDRGKPAVHHILAGLRSNPGAKVTYMFPQHSANYEDRVEIIRFMEDVHEQLGAKVGPHQEVEGLVLPVGQYWPRYHPMGRLALQQQAFNR